MSQYKIFETERLILKQTLEEDAEFIFQDTILKNSAKSKLVLASDYIQ